MAASSSSPTLRAGAGTWLLESSDGGSDVAMADLGDDLVGGGTHNNDGRPMTPASPTRRFMRPSSSRGRASTPVAFRGLYGVNSRPGSVRHASARPASAAASASPAASAAASRQSSRPQTAVLRGAKLELSPTAAVAEMGMSGYDQMRQRNTRIRSPDLSCDERSFVLNSRVIGVTIHGSPASTTAREEFPLMPETVYAAVPFDVDFSQNHRQAGEFTGFARESVRKNVNLKAIGHA